MRYNPRYMPLSSGTRLGPYEILNALGAGGMGEVYRARDTRLGRDVAIKISPPHLSESTEARQRFEREARSVSSLNHPHICALYDIGSEDGTAYLVMEYLEGETLAQRLEKGPLSLEQFLRTAIEIAEALDKAHRPRCGASRREAGERDVDESGRQVAGFRLGEGAPASAAGSFHIAAASPAPRDRRREQAHHRRRDDRGHGPVHGAGATGRARSRCEHAGVTQPRQA